MIYICYNTTSTISINYNAERQCCFDNFIVVPPIMYLILPIIIVQNEILIFYYYNDYCNFRATVKRKS